MNYYSVYDKETMTYSAPFPEKSDITALRLFKMEVNRADNGNMLNHAPEHFCLWRISTFDDTTGDFTTSRQLLSEAIAMVTPKE